MKSKLVRIDLHRTTSRDETASVVVQVPEDATSSEIEEFFSDDTNEEFFDWDQDDSWTDDLSASSTEADEDDEGPTVYCVRDADHDLQIVTADEAFQQLFDDDCAKSEETE